MVHFRIGQIAESIKLHAHRDCDEATSFAATLQAAAMTMPAASAAAAAAEAISQPSGVVWLAKVTCTVVVMQFGLLVGAYVSA